MFEDWCQLVYDGSSRVHVHMMAIETIPCTKSVKNLGQAEGQWCLKACSNQFRSPEETRPVVYQFPRHYRLVGVVSLVIEEDDGKDDAEDERDQDLVR